MGDYLKHRPEMVKGREIKRRKSSTLTGSELTMKATSIWPGLSDNMRVLMWIGNQVIRVLRDGVENSIGYEPKPEDINRFEGLDIDLILSRGLLDADVDLWKGRSKRGIQEFHT